LHIWIKLNLFPVPWLRIWFFILKVSFSDKECSVSQWPFGIYDSILIQALESVTALFFCWFTVKWVMWVGSDFSSISFDICFNSLTRRTVIKKSDVGSDWKIIGTFTCVYSFIVVVSIVVDGVRGYSVVWSHLLWTFP
jgi:hypothetical protein